MVDADAPLFDPSVWREVDGFTDITYHRSRRRWAACASRSTARRCATPSARTRSTSCTALEHARTSADVGAVLLTGNGPSSGTAARVLLRRGPAHPRAHRLPVRAGETEVGADEKGRAGRLHILECQRLIRFMPKVVIAVVNGWAAGGGHSLHAVCDLTLASAEHARFKQTDADVGSFDAAFGSAYLARPVGQKFAREIFFLGRTYTAEQMHAMGAVNEAVPHAELETTAVEWARAILGKSPRRSACSSTRSTSPTTASSASSSSPARPPAWPT